YIDGTHERRAAMVHHHAGVGRELRQEAEGGSKHGTQLLAPPGYRKTQVLLELQAALRKKGRPCVYVSAGTVANVVTFWQDLAEKLEQQQIPIASPKSNDYYNAVVGGLSDRGCVLLIDDPDSWL